MPLLRKGALAFLLFCAGAGGQAPEDAILSEELLSGPRLHSFVRAGGLVGTGGLWAVETEAGHEVAPRSNVSVMAARSQLDANATTEIWVNGQTWWKDAFSVGLSAIHGFGPGREIYYGGLLSASVPAGQWRIKLQSGVLRFELPDIIVNSAPLRTFQVPIRGEVGLWMNRDFILSVGAATYLYTEDRSALTSVLATTTLTTGVGILSGFPLNQFFVRSEFYPAPDLVGSLGVSSALSAYQTNRVFAISGRLEWEITREWILGADVSVSRTGTRQWNFAIGPTLYYGW